MNIVLVLSRVGRRAAPPESNLPGLMRHIPWVALGILLFPIQGALAARFPVSARLTLAPTASQHCLKVTGGVRTDCSIIEQARAAFSAKVAEMFLSRPDPDLELVLTVTDAEIFETVSGGMDFEARTQVQVFAPGGALVDELTAVGRVPVTEQTPVMTAAGVAARNAAHDFEERYASSGKVSDYLVGRKIAPASAVTIPERGDRILSFSLGAGLVQGGGDGGAAVQAPSLDVGWSMRWFTLHARYSRYASAFQGEDRVFTYASELTTSDLGIEAGAVMRMGRAVELHAGPGMHYLFGEGSATIPVYPSGLSFGKIVPTLSASLSASFLPFSNGVRLFAGIEGRAYFFSTIGLREMGRTVPAANSSYAFFAGVEFPWGQKERSFR